MLWLELAFWMSVALLAFAQAGYPLLLSLILRVRRTSTAYLPRRAGDRLPRVTLIVACHNEERVVAAKVKNALALDYPPELLEVIVASDGSTDSTLDAARRAAADDPRVRALDLPRAGKVRTQDAAVAEASGEILAFSDANSLWERSALKSLVRGFVNPDIGYACGEVRFVDSGGTNQEGLYWRYEMAVRRMESRIASVTAGNGAIYATRADSYIEVDPRMGHDLSLPFNMVKNGWRAVFVPGARAVEKMVPSIEGEFRRKRRMMSHTWLIVLRGGMLDPRGYGPLYAVEIFAHRLLRYSAPFLHLIALGTSIALAPAHILYLVLASAQGAVIVMAALAPLVRGRVRSLNVAYYYVSMMAALLAGLWDYLRHGVSATWQPIAEAR